MATRRSRLVPACALLGALLAAVAASDTATASAARDTAGPAPPNLLVIIIDAQRADHLSSYGYPRPTTPRIDAYAARGARFTRAISVSNRTGTSMSSLWTGLLPSRHGVFRTGDVLAETFTTSAEMLGARGYRTGAWCPNPSLDRSFGHAQGWQSYDDDLLEDRHDEHLAPWKRWETATAINERALRWIDAEPGKPFLAWLHYRDVHGPYVPPPPYDAMFPPLGKRQLTATEVAARPTYLTLPDDGNDLHHYLSQYDGDVRYTDERIADLLGELERRGVLERTVVVITADHGEAFLDHGQWNHDVTLYEEELHIPLIVLRPGGKPQVIDRLVSSIDLFPTLLELAGAPLPPTDGESLLPLLDGDDAAYRRTSVVSESRAPWRRRQRMLRDDRWKLISSDSYLGSFFPVTLELYDLERDPRETKDVSRAEAERTRAMAAALDGALASAPVARASRSGPSEDLGRRLEALGYVE